LFVSLNVSFIWIPCMIYDVVGYITIIGWCRMNCKKWLLVLMLSKFLVLMLVKCWFLGVFIWTNTNSYCLIFHFKMVYALFMLALQLWSLVVVSLCIFHIFAYLRSIWSLQHPFCCKHTFGRIFINLIFSFRWPQKMNSKECSMTWWSSLKNMSLFQRHPSLLPMFHLFSCLSLLLDSIWLCWFSYGLWFMKRGHIFLVHCFLV